MSLPDSSTNVLKTIPSYLYFQYIDDENIPALIQSYNALTQEYVDWFNSINLPIYTDLEGALLDWVGQGVYGLIRPRIQTSSIAAIYGPIGGSYYHGPAVSGPIPNMVPAIDTFQVDTDSVNYDTPDDIYKRILTWWFYKGDGFVFSIPWLKTRIVRFLHGTDGKDGNYVASLQQFSEDVSVQFLTTSPVPTCQINIYNSSGDPVAQYLEAAIENQVLALPFRFVYSVALI